MERHANVAQTIQRTKDAAGVQRRHHQVSGFGGLYGVTRRIRVSHLAHDDDVRIGAHERFDRGAEIQTHAWIGVHLRRVRQSVFDRILDGVHRAVHEIDFADGGAKGRGFTGTGRAADQTDTVRP